MRAKLTQQALADVIGVTRSSISQYEAGIIAPSRDMLVSLANALNADIRELLPPGVHLSATASPMLVQESAVDYGEPTRFDVHFEGPLSSQPHVDLPYADGKALASFDPNMGLSLMSFVGSRTVRLYLRPGELPSRYEGAMVVEIWGDSMEPQLHSGDRMIVWFIPDSKWHTLHNTACVVAYDDTVTVKAIRENDLLTEDRLTLRAANPKAGYFTVGLASIRSIWEVREYYDRPLFSLNNWGS